MTDAPVCPDTGAPMVRDVRPMTIQHRSKSSTFEMPGWYSPQPDKSIHTAEDLKVSDRALMALKA